MKKFNENENEILKVLRLIDKNNQISQRGISKDLGVSVGKVNYILNLLRKKGLVKIKNFKVNMTSRNPERKIRYLYILTSKGIKEKITRTLVFIKKMSKEYDELKKEIKKSEKDIH